MPKSSGAGTPSRLSWQPTRRSATGSTFTTSAVFDGAQVVVPGQQIAEAVGHREHPLAHRHPGQDGVDQMQTICAVLVYAAAREYLFLFTMTISSISSNILVRLWTKNFAPRGHGISCR